MLRRLAEAGGCKPLPRRGEEREGFFTGMLGSRRRIWLRRLLPEQTLQVFSFASTPGKTQALGFIGAWQAWGTFRVSHLPPGRTFVRRRI